MAGKGIYLQETLLHSEIPFELIRNEQRELYESRTASGGESRS